MLGRVSVLLSMAIILSLSLLVVINNNFLASAQSISSEVGPNWEKSCSNGICTFKLYGNVKYLNGQEINENFQSSGCSAGFSYCTQENLYKAQMSSQGLVKLSKESNELAMQLLTVNLLPPAFSLPVQNQNQILFSGILPTIDIRYSYTPTLFKEEIILNQNPNQDLTFTYSIVQNSNQFLIGPIIVYDSGSNEIEVPSTYNNSIFTFTVPQSFLADPNVTYPVIIDPTIILNSSNVSWDGYVDKDLTGGGIIFNRFSTPSSLLLEYKDLNVTFI